jgi:hypothetical protein
MPAYGHTSTAPHRRSPANLRARESATTYLHPSAASPASAVGTGLKQKKQKKRLHSAPHTVFEASLLLCIESFARHTIRRPAASLPVRVRPELRAERYRRPQRVRRAQSPAWFTLPSEVTLSLSLGAPLDWSLWVVARRFRRIAVLPTQRWVISGTSRVLSVRCTAKSDLYCSPRNLSVCSGSTRRREFHHLLLLIQRVV